MIQKSIVERQRLLYLWSAQFDRVAWHGCTLGHSQELDPKTKERIVGKVCETGP